VSRIVRPGGIEALIFDLDGTLVDTLDDIADALNRVLGARGLPVHARAAVRAMIGEGAANLVRAALPPVARDLVPDVLEEFRRDYFAKVLVRSAPYPGVAGLLAELARRGLPMCVLSNKPHAPTRALVAALFATTPFVEVAGQRPERPIKPDPTVALELARAMGVAPAACGFVGDSGVDMRTASAAGMRGIGVTWGFRDAAELIEHGAAALIEVPEQLLEACQTLAKR
jgi:phosphoglycolate phosphatase